MLNRSVPNKTNDLSYIVKQLRKTNERSLTVKWRVSKFDVKHSGDLSKFPATTEDVNGTIVHNCS